MALDRWAIILAAGEGTRVRTMTMDHAGVALPKQFWSPGNGRPMIRWTLRRAGRLTSLSRIVTVVAAQHRALWSAALPGEALAHVVVQPENRGTATGILLPLLCVLRRDRDARVAILPADHAVDDEEVLIEALERAFDLVNQDRPIVLLGMAPDRADPGYGWIVSGSADEDGSRPVLSFHEKPDAPVARRLFLAGAHWSSFMLVAKARALLSIYERHAPRLVSALAQVCDAGDSGTRGDRMHGSLERLYSSIPITDFSHGILEEAVSDLRMLPVPHCGWTDLGTPERIERWTRDHRVGRFEYAEPHVA